MWVVQAVLPLGARSLARRLLRQWIRIPLLSELFWVLVVLAVLVPSEVLEELPP